MTAYLYKKTIDVVLLMAGAGKRFNLNENAVIKPLYPVKNRPLFSYALNSVLGQLPSLKLSVSVLNNHWSKIKPQLDNYATNYQIIKIDTVLNGPLETALYSAEYIDRFNVEDKPIIFLDCDLMFSCEEFFKDIGNIEEDSFSAKLVYFKSKNPSYSYAIIENEIVTKMAEKVVISDNAIAGCYYMSSRKMFMNICRSYLQKKSEIGENYISHFYSEIIKRGYTVRAYQCDQYISLGTPLEILSYLEE